MRVAIVAVCIAAVAAGCSAAVDEPEARSAKPPAALPSVSLRGAVVVEARTLRTEPPVAKRCVAGTEDALGSSRIAFAGSARGATTAYRRPGGQALERFEKLNVNGFDTVFGVLAVVRNVSCEPVWYRVQLPIRPNGAIGYVRADAIDLYTVHTRIEIDLSERRLELYRNGRLVRHVTTAVGKPGTPTPTGRFYVNQRIIAGDPSGPWGPAALGISAFSPTLVNWTQGGPIAIHGTSNRDSVGHAASNGCLRLFNEDLERLYDETPAGTPVVIRA